MWHVGAPGSRATLIPRESGKDRRRTNEKESGYRPMTTIKIPPVLRENTGGSRTVDVTGGTVSEALDDLFGKHPALRDRVTENGQLSTFINVYVNDRDVRYREGLETAIGGDDTIILLPAMAGGAR